MQKKSKKLTHFEDTYNKQITPNDFRNQNQFFVKAQMNLTSQDGFYKK